MKSSEAKCRKVKSRTQNGPSFLRKLLHKDVIGKAIDYAKHRSRSHDAVIRVYDGTGNVIEMHEHKVIFASSRTIFFSSLTPLVCCD